MMRQKRKSAVLGWLLALLAGAFLIAPVSAAEGHKARTAEDRILAALDQITAVNFVDEPLANVLEFLGKRHNIEIQFDMRALVDVSMGTDEPVTRRLQNVKLRSALNFVLGDLDLTWVITDEVLLITTPEEAERYTYTKVYDVTDLVKVLDAEGNASSDFNSLIDVIAGSVQPESWGISPFEISPLEYRGARVLIILPIAVGARGDCPTA